jgi:hypothetical protein
MKMYMEKDEIYPVYQFCDTVWGKEVEISEELYKEINEAIDKFWVAQRKLSDLYDGEERYNFSWEDKL